MEKSKPLTLGFEELKNRTELITHAEFRSIRQGVGMVNSFAQMESALFRVGQPYRARESRIVRILRGTGRLSINLVEHEVSAQTIVVCPSNSLIELKELSPDYDFQILVTENDFLPTLSGSTLNNLYEQYGSIIPLTAEEWEHTGIFFALVWDTMHRTPFRKEVVQHLITALLYDLKYIRDQKQTSITAHPSRQEEVLRRFIALVNEHGKHERNVSFYADKLYLTSRYLSTVIRETSGQTVMQWINQAVILEAKVLLKHSDLLVFQISDELNFPNPSFFSKFFKRMTGMTPAEYQKK